MRIPLQGPCHLFPYHLEYSTSVVVFVTVIDILVSVEGLQARYRGRFKNIFEGLSVQVVSNV